MSAKARNAQARVQSTLATERAFIKPPIEHVDDLTPPVRTAVGLSYSALTNQIALTAETAQNNGGIITQTDVQALMDSLYLAPRLKQWHHVVGGVYDEYRLYTTNDAIYVSVTESRIWITKGIREFDIVSGAPATALYKALETAQSIVQPANPKPMTEEEQEEFFSSDDANGADIDSALADAPTYEPVVEDPEMDDEGLIGEVHEATAPSFVEEETKRYSGQINQKNAKIDGVICGYCGNLNKQTYRGPCPQCPKHQDIEKAVNKTAVQMASNTISYLKSLQGRVLTIMDGAFADKVQREAVKTLINKEFRRSMNKVNFDPEVEE